MESGFALKDGDAMERAVRALAKCRYAAPGDAVASGGHPKERHDWLLETASAEAGAILDHVDDGGVLGIQARG